MCLNPKCKRQKQITFRPNQFHLEEPDSEKQWKNFERKSKAWDSCVTPAVNTLAPVIGVAVGAKSKTPQVEQARKIFSRVNRVVKLYLQPICTVRV